MRRIIFVLLMFLVTLLSPELRAGEASDLFESLFGKRIATVKATATKTDDVELAAEVLAIVPDRAAATRVSPGLPKVAFVAPRSAYRTTGGDTLAAETHDFHARYLSMQTAHRSYAAAGSIGGRSRGGRRLWSCCRRGGRRRLRRCRRRRGRG